VVGGAGLLLVAWLGEQLLEALGKWSEKRKCDGCGVRSRTSSLGVGHFCPACHTYLCSTDFRLKHGLAVTPAQWSAWLENGAPPAPTPPAALAQRMDSILPLADE
jgi:hypothetical protein